MKRPKTTVLSQIRILCFACGLLWFAGATVVDAKIVFCIEDDIYVMNDNGSAIRRLTTQHTVERPSSALVARWQNLELPLSDTWTRRRCKPRLSCSS